jgi:phosphatidylinositol alpha-1,6-mannosyltransferase
MKHLLVTNDFPPKLGGIQTYLWELWRRLPADSFVVLTCRQPGDVAFDRTQAFRIVRHPRPVLLPTRGLVRSIEALAAEIDADLVVLDPALPVGEVGRRLTRPYLVVAHGAEIAVPGRLPGARALLARVLDASAGAVAAGGYVAAELRRVANRPVEVGVVPPGVDTERFHTAEPGERRETRRSFGLPESGPLVLSVGRLVPRKGVDVLIDAAASLRKRHPDLTLAVAGEGRDRRRLERRALHRRAPVRFLGRVPDERLPALYASADVFAAPNRTRWGGLEQEGFGIVFVEAAACGVPQVAGRSGGAPEAVEAGETGIVVDRPEDPAAVAEALGVLLDDPGLRTRLSRASRERAVREFSYPVLAGRLAAFLEDVGARTPS